MVEVFYLEKFIIGDNEIYEFLVIYIKLWFSVGFSLQIDGFCFFIKFVIILRVKGLCDEDDYFNECFYVFIGVSLCFEIYSLDGLDCFGLLFQIQEILYEFKVFQL